MKTATEVRIIDYPPDRIEHLGSNGGRCEAHCHLGETSPVATSFISVGPAKLGVYVDLCVDCAALLAGKAVAL